jgi:hypothetical protein
MRFPQPHVYNIVENLWKSTIFHVFFSAPAICGKLLILKHLLTDHRHSRCARSLLAVRQVYLNLTVSMA